MRTLRIGEDVLGADGKKLGSVERLVVDPTAHRITHLVVLGRLVGVDRTADGGCGRLTVDLTPDALRRWFGDAMLQQPVQISDLNRASVVML